MLGVNFGSRDLERACRNVATKETMAMAMMTTGVRAQWHARLATLLASAKRYAQAQHHYEAALALVDEDARSADKTDQNEPRYTRCGQTAEWRYALAGVLAKQGQRACAVAIYQRLVQELPDMVGAHVNLAALLLMDGQLERALQHCELAIGVAPATRDAHFNRNVILRRLGRQQETVEEYWNRIEADVGRKVRVTNCLYGSSEPQDDSGDSKQPTRICVVCVKWGTKYGAEYVNKLYKGVTRHVDAQRVAIRFLCLTDDSADVCCDTLPLDPGWQGWWNKIQLFSPRVSAVLGDSPCVYVDLDTVIVDDITEVLLTSTKTPFALLKTDGMENERRKLGYNSSLMVWRRSDETLTRNLYEVVAMHFQVINQYIYKLDHWLEMALPSVDFLDDLVPRQIVEYKSVKAAKQGSGNLTGCSVVCFPLQPKPHEVIDEDTWIASHW